jgi:hypothetical protein
MARGWQSGLSAARLKASCGLAYARKFLRILIFPADSGRPADFLFEFLLESSVGAPEGPPKHPKKRLK